MADWLAQRGFQDASMRVGLIVALAWVPTGMLFPLMPNGNFAAALLVPTVFLMGQPVGVAAAAIQEMMPNAMRAQASALYLFVINLIGLGAGPTAVAMTTTSSSIMTMQFTIRWGSRCLSAPWSRDAPVDWFKAFSAQPRSLEGLDEDQRLDQEGCRPRILPEAALPRRGEQARSVVRRGSCVGPLPRAAVP